MKTFIKYGNRPFTPKEITTLQFWARDFVETELEKKAFKKNGKIFSFKGSKEGGYLAFGECTYMKKLSGIANQLESQRADKFGEQLKELLNYIIDYINEEAVKNRVEIIEKETDNKHVTEFVVTRKRY